MDLTTITIPRYLLVNGRAFRLLGTYSGPGYVAEANAHMEREPTAALIYDGNGTAYLADAEDNGCLVYGADRQPRSLECCCCGGGLKGRQWHNRDTGYGLCVSCIDYCARGETVESFESCYGLRGVHFDIAL